MEIPLQINVALTEALFGDDHEALGLRIGPHRGECCPLLVEAIRADPKTEPCDRPGDCG